MSTVNRLDSYLRISGHLKPIVYQLFTLGYMNLVLKLIADSLCNCSLRLVFRVYIGVKVTVWLYYSFVKPPRIYNTTTTAPTATMKFGLFVGAFTALITSAVAQKVSGAAEGFAQGVTGGGSATPVTPRNIQELVTYLTDKSPRVIVLDRTYDFTGSEGTVRATGCAPWGTGKGCQLAINSANFCGTQPAAQVTYDKAGTAGINVASDKTIIGVGNKGIIKGKGLRFVNVKNIIVQNIRKSALTNKTDAQLTTLQMSLTSTLNTSGAVMPLPFLVPARSGLTIAR